MDLTGKAVQNINKQMKRPLIFRVAGVSKAAEACNMVCQVA